MSAIRKTPYIETVLASLNAEQFAALKTAINSAADGTDGNYSFLPGGTNIPALTEEVTYNIECATIQLGRDKQRNGILVHTSNYCVFLVYGESQKITIYNLNRTNKTYSLVEEYCDIEELRRVLNDGEEAAGDAWVEKMKEHLDYSPTSEERIGGVECGTNLWVDGSLYVNSNVGQIVKQADFMDLTSLHPDITISDFSVYELGQLVIGHFKYTTESIAANEKLFDIKTAYKPKKEQVRLCVNNSGEAIAYKMLTSGEVDTLSSVSGTPAKTVYMDFIYEA